MYKAVYFHAGCPVCVETEQQLLSALDKQQYTIEHVHLGENKQRIAEAQQLGIKSVPALVLDGQVFHINFGAAMEAL